MKKFLILFSLLFMLSGCATQLPDETENTKEKIEKLEKQAEAGDARALLLEVRKSLLTDKWPQLEKNEKQECPPEMAKKILSMTESMFNSSLTKMSGNSKKNLESIFGKDIEVLISGGAYNLEVNDEIFETIHNVGIGYDIFWQKEPTKGKRCVILVCHGALSRFFLFSVNESLSQEEFIDPQKAKDRYINPTTVEPIVDSASIPPIIFKHLPSQQIWMIIPSGSFFEFYHISAKEPCCTVRFCSRVKLLPNPVKQLASLLDGTLGDEKSYGTGTYSLWYKRSEIAETWLDVALRPWVVNSAHNTRKGVDSGLSKWSSKNKSFMDHYKKIYEQYPKAEQALSQYYQDKFQLIKEKSDRLAGYVLDLAFRGSFYFQDEEVTEGKVATANNPWNS